jgi:hypothetical protein
MRKLLACLGWLGMLCGATAFAAQAQRLVGEVSRASVRGRATVSEVINRKAATNPVRDLQVYLFATDSVKPFEELQRKCRRAMAQPKADAEYTYRLCEAALAEAVQLIPTLPAVATAKTGADGAFSFENVTPGKLYHVIGVKPGEDGSPVVIVVKTARLRPGQQVAVELSENAPWTEPAVE